MGSCQILDKIPLNGLVGPLGVTQLPLEDDGWMANVIGHNTTTPPLARAQSQLNSFLIFSERLCKFFNSMFSWQGCHYRK